jgi:hypothetical protein
MRSDSSAQLSKRGSLFRCVSLPNEPLDHLVDVGVAEGRAGNDDPGIVNDVVQIQFCQRMDQLERERRRRTFDKLRLRGVRFKIDLIRHHQEGCGGQLSDGVSTEGLKRRNLSSRSLWSSIFTSGRISIAFASTTKMMTLQPRV